MIELRPFDSLGGADHGWLDTKHHFSFAEYHDPSRLHWGALRVWNDDHIAANSGFPPHPHDNMEIITYVRTGAITHKDSLGNQGRTEAGDVQVMSAGTGIRHAEYNEEDEETSLFQIWILPDRDKRDRDPQWGAKPFPRNDRAGSWAILASGHEDDEGALSINADARVVGATVRAGETLEYVLGGRKAYVVAATGTLDLHGTTVNTRDGAAIADLETLSVKALEDSEIVLVDVA